MPKQPAFPGLRAAMKNKLTRREQFLAQMDAVVPWGRVLALIAPHYPKTGPKGGRPPMPLEVMLRVYFLQNWYAARAIRWRKRRFMTARRCGALPGSSSATTASRTVRRDRGPGGAA